MPFLYEGKIAVRPSELIPRFFSSEHHISMTIYRHKKLPYGLRKLSGGGNGRELLIDFDSLDIEIRNELGDIRKIKSWMSHFFEMDAEAIQFYSEYRFEDGSGLKTEHIEKYSMNASTLNACKMLWVARERERLTKGGSKAGIGKSVWEDALNYRKLQEAEYKYCHSLPDNERRFLETYKKYLSEGYGTLISKKHKSLNALKVTADVIDLLNAMFAGTRLKPTATQVAKQYQLFLLGKYEVIDNDSGEVIQPAGYPALGESTIMAYLSKWENTIGTHLKRAGDRQRYLNNYKVPHSMDRPNYAGSLISIDDRNPPFVMPDGKRVWFYCGIDLCSEVWTVYVHGKSKEGIIMEFYREMIRNYAAMGIGMPLELECESSLNSGLVKSGLLKDGILFRKVRVEANNAVGKKIERYFRELRYGMEKEMDGWQARPFAKSEANQEATEKVITRSYKEIVEQTIGAMKEWNNSEHPIYRGKTRLEVHRERQNPACKSVAWEVVLPHIGKKTPTSCNTGLVKLNKRLFCLAHKGKLASGDLLISMMSRIEGQDVDVYWLDDKVGNVLQAYAYDKKGNMLCELIAKPRYNRATFERTDADNEAYSLMSAYANTVESYGRTQKNSIMPITIIKHVEPSRYEDDEVEVLPDIDEEEDLLKYLPKRKSLFERFL